MKCQGFGERSSLIYMTFFPQALHPGFVVWTRLIIEDMNDMGAGDGVADLTIGGAETYPL
jgi:hypothetical protein